MADSRLFIKHLMKEAEGGNLPPPFVRALEAASKKTAAKKTAKRPGRPRTVKL